MTDTILRGASGAKRERGLQRSKMALGISSSARNLPENGASSESIKRSEPGRRRSSPALVVNAVAREFELSGRERDVLLAAARGMYTKAIAVDLGLSGKTVEYYWTRIFEKLRCSSQMEVMSLLLRRAAKG